MKFGLEQKESGFYVAEADVLGPMGPNHPGYIASLKPAPAGAMWYRGNIEWDFSVTPKVYAYGVVLVKDTTKLQVEHG